MAASQKSTALTKRSASDALMPPPAAPKRIKRPRVVLDEDTYVSAISHIIRRDFYPGLAEIEAQRDYLNALGSKNNAWIRDTGNKLTQAMTPVPGGKRWRQSSSSQAELDKTPLGRAGQTPSVWGGDTPLTLAGTEVGEEEKQPEVNLDLGINAFQAKYISEDQESFSQIIDMQNAKRFEKNDWVRNGNRYPSKQRVAQQKVIEASKSTSEPSEAALRPSQNLDERQAGPTIHKHAGFNTLMFGPESIEPWAPTRAQIAEDTSLAPPKQVLYNNTRMPLESSEPARPPSPTLSAVRDAIAGNPRLTKSEVGYSGSETPRVNGYAFVDALPPSPEDSDEAAAPTDLLERYGAKASHATPFIIHEAQRREKLHNKMVERIGAKKTTGSSVRGVGTGLGIFAGETPKFLSAPTPARLLAGGTTPGRKHVGSLTPAAQKLLGGLGKTPRGSGAGGFASGSGLSREWTPTTARVRRRA
ncbi:nuclear protein DGCR14 [Massariosphaeria phaeospora]|uniref:Nuclear protein DGCR14 n=1 Tax=Massariosphaeria phaeospora TaxID=100035 RepID=A0A7C8MK37_9PLEO|nr:nuclear protein DGCR14 [Massariosphaeria phaeospora]